MAREGRREVRRGFRRLLTGDRTLYTTTAGDKICHGHCDPLSSTSGVYKLWAYGRRMLYTIGAENSGDNIPKGSVPPLYKNESSNYVAG